jgi:hypothetical protein
VREPGRENQFFFSSSSDTSRELQLAKQGRREVVRRRESERDEKNLA